MRNFLKIGLWLGCMFVFLLSAGNSYAAQEDFFVTVWDTTLPGTSNSTSITVPAVGGPYNVDWDNDGIVDETGLTGNVTHDFGAEGTYTVNIENLTQIQFAGLDDSAKITELSQWGTSTWVDMSAAFKGTINMIVTATDVPDLFGVTSLSEMFYGAILANPDTLSWDTSTVVTFYDMFLGATSATPDTSLWNTSSAEIMTGMFNGATSANPDVYGWDVGGVTHFTGMFTDAVSATPDTSIWNTASAVNFEAMFAGATQANPDTSGWETGSVTNMFAMFYQAASANPNVSGWDTTNVLNMRSLFNGATSANPDVLLWDTSSVTNMARVFANTTFANPNVSNWDTSSVTDMSEMFLDAVGAYPEVDNWSVYNVTDFTRMFKGSSLSSSSFDTWDVSSAQDMTEMFSGVMLPSGHYDEILTAWSQLTLQSNVVFDAGVDNPYCSGGYARETLVNSFNWTITDGGFGCTMYDPASFSLQVSSNLVGTNEPVTLTVSALDGEANPDAAYTGTVHISTTPNTAVVPGDYTFTIGDNGVYVFTDGVSFNSAGPYTIHVRDVNQYEVFGSIGVGVSNATIDYSTFGTSFVVPQDYKNYGTPYGIAVLDNGDAWYVNKRDRQLVRVSSTGQILRVVGRAGSGDGEFAEDPSGVTVDQFGYVYVSDYCKVSKFDQYGGFIKSWGGCDNATSAGLSGIWDVMYSSYHDEILVSDENNVRIARFSREGEYLGRFGGTDSDLSQLNTPHILDVDANGNIVVVDHGSPRALVYDPNFNLTATVGSANWGDNDYFDAPKDVEILEDGRFVVTSQNSNDMKVFNLSGEYLATWGGYGTGDGEFVSPQFITEDSTGNVWITDWGINRIVMLDRSGNYVKSYHNNGGTNGRLDRPFSVAIDSAGNIYALDWLTDQGRVQMFSSAGEYVRTVVTPGQTGISFYHLAIDNEDNVYVSHAGGVRVFNPAGELIEEIGSPGTGDGQFEQARGMAFNSTYTRLYVADSSNHRVQIFDISGATAAFVSSFSNMNGELGYLMYPEHIYVDHTDGNLVYTSGRISNDVGDGAGNTVAIAKFDTDGNYVGYFDYYQNDVTGYRAISGLSLDSEGSIIVTDDVLNRMQIYDNSGAHLYTLGGRGGGLNQFDGARSGKVHPTTGEIVVVDTNNHRLEFWSEGVSIQNLIPSTDVLKQADGQSLVSTMLPLPGAENVLSLMKFGDHPISAFSVDMSQSRDWSLVNAIALPDQSKSLVVNLNPTDAVGVSETHSLYVAKKPGQAYVRVCPNALQISDVNLQCDGGYNLTDADESVTIEWVDGVEYWVVGGLTGTGAMGQVVNDLQVNAATATTTTGSATDVTFTAYDEDGVLMTDYAGTVLLEVSPSADLLMSSYTFGSGDAGRKTINDLVVFYNPGTYTIKATDSSNRDVVGTFVITVTGAVSSTSNNSSSSVQQYSSTINGVCRGLTPANAPDLFQIDVTNNSAKLFFTPISNANDFYISFSTSPNAEQHGEKVTLLREGVQSHSVYHLKPNTTYYFKVRGQNDCKVGEWSNIVMLKTAGGKFSSTLTYYKNRIYKSVSRLISPLAPVAKPILPKAQESVAPTTTQPVLTIAPTQKETMPSPKKKACFLWWCW